MNRTLRLGIYSLTGVIAIVSSINGQVQGGDQVKRTDCDGKDYYEVHARNTSGNRGGSVPLVGNQWAKRVTVETMDACMARDNIVKDPTNTLKYSFWFIASFNNPVYGDGTGPGTTGEGRTPDNQCACPQLPKWALVARWMSFDNNSGEETPVSDWFSVGKGGTFYVPIPSRIVPSPVVGGSYNPDVYLQYLCNDDDHSDNGGWQHIYESWSQQ